MQNSLDNQKCGQLINEHFLVCKTNVNGVIEYVNQNYADAHGYDASEMIGVKQSHFASGLHTHAFWSQFWSQLLHEKSWKGEICNRSRAGQLVWLDVTINAHVNEEGEVLEFFMVCSDISKKKTYHESALLASLYQRQAENDAALALITTDRDGVIRIMNSTAEVLLGREKHDVLNLCKLTDFLDANELKRRSEILITEMGVRFESPLDVLTTHSRFNLRNDADWTFLRANGKKFNASINITVLKDVLGEMIGWMILFRDVTIQRTLEDNLKRSQLLWQTAVENSSLGVWDWNVETNEVYFSNQWKKMIGYNSDEIRNDLSEWSKRVHPDDLPSVMSLVQDHLEGKTKSYESQHRLLCKDGSWKWILDKGRICERLSGGKPKRFIGTHTDITIQKDHEIKAKKDALKLRTILENTDAIIWAVDSDLRLIDFNSHFVDFVVGTYNVVPRIHMDVLEIHSHVEFQKEYWNSLYARAIDGEEIENEICHPREGLKLWMHYSLRAIRDVNGDVVGLCVYGSDITEDRFKSRQIQDSEARLRAILESAKTSIWSFDHEMKLTAFNSGYAKTYEEYFQIAPRIGDSIIAHFSRYPSSEKLFLGYYERVLAGESFEVEQGSTGIDGKEYHFAITFNPIFSRQGKVIGGTCMSTNATDRIIAERQLKAAKELAESSFKAKSQFLSVMSHEIRTPMNAVIGMTHLLLEENPSDTQKEYLETLRFSAENLLVLINDILDFSKIEAGKIELERIPVNLPQLMKNISNSLSLKALEGNTQIQIEFDEKMPSTYLGDPVRLGQILTNLVSNAVKFTKNGTVTIGARPLLGGDGRVCMKIFVRDTGIGIPEDKIGAIFEAFTQASADTTRNFGGTGLGLAITKKLIEIHGSQIQVTSVLGQGSEFFFELYLEPTEKQSLILSQEAATQITDLKGARILLVEDNAVNVKVASKFIEKWNAQLSVAHNGQEAVDLIRSMSEYDVILMDLHMPVLDGYSASKEIRALQVLTPILALTAESIQEVQESALACGMNDFVGKPFNPKELYAKIEFWIHQ